MNIEEKKENLMDTAYFYLTEEGKSLAEKLAASHPGDIYGKEHFKEQLRQAFATYDYLVCIMAAGIVVRILAPLIHHKTSDPGVVVLDQKGQYAISLLSGHLGGANDLAREMAALSGGEAVITTATDVAGELSFDTFAKSHNMAIENIGQLKFISSALLSGRQIQVISDYAFPELQAAASQGKIQLRTTANLKNNILSADSSHGDECGSTDHHQTDPSMVSSAPLPTVVIDEGLILDHITAPILYLRPRTICAGIGCKRGMEPAPIEEALRQVLTEEHLSPLSLKCISTIPLKADEPGILATAEHLNVPVEIIPTEEIETLDMGALGIQSSVFVAQQTGVWSVSTASSYLASGKGQILRDKVKFKGITIALCKEKK